jgi:hypothetical protein
MIGPLASIWSFEDGPGSGEAWNPLSRRRRVCPNLTLGFELRSGTPCLEDQLKKSPQAATVIEIRFGTSRHGQFNRVRPSDRKGAPQYSTSWPVTGIEP